MFGITIQVLCVSHDLWILFLFFPILRMVVYLDINSTRMENNKPHYLYSIVVFINISY